MPTEWAAEVMVRLNADDAGALLVVQREHPGCKRAETFRQILRAAVCPQDLLLRYRMPEGHPLHAVFPNWMPWGPFSPVEAVWRVESLQRKGYEVEAVQIAPRVPRPAWPDEPNDLPASCVDEEDENASQT